MPSHLDMLRAVLHAELDEQAADEAAWKGALERIRASGRDPDVVIAKATQNLKAWRALSHERRLAIAEAMDERRPLAKLVGFRESYGEESGP